MVTCIHPRHGAEPPIAGEPMTLCQPCYRRLTRDLDDIIALWPLLAGMMTPGSSSGGGSTSGKPGSRPPCDLDIVDITHRAGLTSAQLISWSALVIEERQLAARTIGDGEQAARLLSIHAEWLACQPFADEACDEISKAAHRIRRACKDLPDPPLGKCPDIDPRGESDRCGGPLRWIDGTVAVICGRCGSRWRSDDLVNVGRVSPLNLWESVPHVAAMLDMSERTLRHWVMGGRVKRNSLGHVRHADVWRILAEKNDPQQR